ncbi:MAG: tetratricopeptide repeat protein [Bacteroidota bacterium]
MKVFLTIIGLATLVIINSNNDCMAANLEFGPYEVGFETYKAYDDSRLFILGEDTISRPLLIHFWYPSKEKGEGHALTFKDYIDLIALREDYGRSKSEIDNHSFYYVKGYSDFAKGNFGIDTSMSVQFLLDSPVYAKTGISVQNTESAFPLLIYAPSNSKASVQNHMLCEYLASHGFMILSVASAGPNSMLREKFEESTMAQVMDMEYILKFCEDSLQINYTSLGLFGFSSGGNAITLFQMRNKDVGAVLSLDGGQEYVTYMKLYVMPDFDPDKADVPYLSLVNNYEDFSIYPLYNSIISTEKYLYRLPHLDHNGFISYWTYFDSCSPDSIKSNASISFEYLSKCAEGFFSKYLKPEKSISDSSFTGELASKYIQAINQDYSSINILFKTLLDNDLNSATSLVEQHKEVLLSGANQVNLLARMFSDTDMAVWLYQKCVVYQPESWEAHYNLGYIYKEKGDTLLAKKALLEAKELSPENHRITELLIELKKME